jgi:hypothetical protein
LACDARQDDQAPEGQVDGGDVLQHGGVRLVGDGRIRGSVQSEDGAFEVVVALEDVRGRVVELTSFGNALRFLRGGAQDMDGLVRRLSRFQRLGVGDRQFLARRGVEAEAPIEHRAQEDDGALEIAARDGALGLGNAVPVAQAEGRVELQAEAHHRAVVLVGEATPNPSAAAVLYAAIAVR